MYPLQFMEILSFLVLFIEIKGGTSIKRSNSHFQVISITGLKETHKGKTYKSVITIGDKNDGRNHYFSGGTNKKNDNNNEDKMSIYDIVSGLDTKRKAKILGKHFRQLLLQSKPRNYKLQARVKSCKKEDFDLSSSNKNVHHNGVSEGSSMKDVSKEKQNDVMSRHKADLLSVGRSFSRHRQVISIHQDDSFHEGSRDEGLGVISGLTSREKRSKVFFRHQEIQDDMLSSDQVDDSSDDGLQEQQNDGISRLKNDVLSSDASKESRKEVDFDTERIDRQLEMGIKIVFVGGVTLKPNTSLDELPPTQPPRTKGKGPVNTALTVAVLLLVLGACLFVVILACRPHCVICYRRWKDRRCHRENIIATSDPPGVLVVRSGSVLHRPHITDSMKNLMLINEQDSIRKVLDRKCDKDNPRDDDDDEDKSENIRRIVNICQDEVSNGVRGNYNDNDDGYVENIDDFDDIAEYEDENFTRNNSLTEPLTPVVAFCTPTSPIPSLTPISNPKFLNTKGQRRPFLRHSSPKKQHHKITLRNASKSKRLPNDLSRSSVLLNDSALKKNKTDRKSLHVTFSIHDSYIDNSPDLAIVKIKEENKIDKGYFSNDKSGKIKFQAYPFSNEDVDIDNNTQRKVPKELFREYISPRVEEETLSSKRLSLSLHPNLAYRCAPLVKNDEMSL